MIAALFPFLTALIDRILPDESARAAAKMELLKAENQQAISEMQASLAGILAEAQSADRWTSRARPSFLYVMYLMLLLCMTGGIIGIWYPAETRMAAENIGALLRALPEDLYNLFAMGYLGYTGARSFEKWKKR
jgi:hypothetical protein